ncbi:hypothetical protein [Abyssalbus ytuae]|uniref:Uncharacterized protein n=1 Tax=Abyssalbus ytuae TaxID=2926907 RepID=A0A9E6ZRR3_9FLAO|nr:hypothetical protein [Abyssalbus ytuae]UOB19350.1 hypothetical protein MQE35_08635 [Abyssalbus ytuae]
MIKKLLSFFTSFLLFSVLFGKEVIPVTETSIVLDLEQSKELFFSFAEGDEIVFSMQMVKGKNIKSVEIVELPSNVILSEFKAEDFTRKIKVKNKGVYMFKLYSSSLTRRVCKIKIDRVPESEKTQNFNTNWKWEVKRDTTYTTYQEDSLVGYKTIKYQENVRELINTTQEEIMLFEKSQKVHSYSNGNPSRTYLQVDLPLLKNSDLLEENLIAWSYWIGVDQEGQEAYKENLRFISKLASQASGTYFQNPLAAIAVGAASELIIPKTGEDVQYYFIKDLPNLQNFLKGEQFYLFDQGKGRAAYGRNDRIKQGTFYIGLHNDNFSQGIEVEVKVLVVKEIKAYQNKVYNKEKEEPQYVTVYKTKMDIVENNIRVPVE